jgi:hypothetical protein
VRRTPIAAVPYRWREPTGHDDLLLVERGPGLATAVELVERRATGEDDGPLGAAALPVGDVDALVLDLRRAALGDRLIAEGRCPACDTAVDVDFSVDAYLAHHRPSRARNAAPDAETGWFRLTGRDVAFRVPTAADVLEAAEAPEPARALAELCIRGARSARDVRAAERAMAALAPTMRDDVEGPCPECGSTVLLDVDARELCLAELRFLAGAVQEDVHLLASSYHWSEREILDLPSARRASYAEYVRAGRGAALSAEAFGA